MDRFLAVLVEGEKGVLHHSVLAKLLIAARDHLQDWKNDDPEEEAPDAFDARHQEGV